MKKSEIISQTSFTSENTIGSILVIEFTRKSTLTSGKRIRHATHNQVQLLHI